VESDNSNVFLSCTLLSLYESSSSIKTDNKTSSDLGIEGSAMSCFFDLGIRSCIRYKDFQLFESKSYIQDSLNPCHDFVTAGVRWLIQIDNSVL